MADLWPFSEFGYGAVVEDKNSSPHKFFWNKSSEPLDHHLHDQEPLKHVDISGAEDWGDSGGIDSLCSINNFGFFTNPEYSSEEAYLLSSTTQQKDPSSYFDYVALDNLRFDMVDDVVKLPNIVDLSQTTKNHRNLSFPLASLDLLNNYRHGFKFNRLHGEADHQANANPIDDSLRARKLSTEDVMRIAGTRFIQSSSSSYQSDGLDLLISHPYDFSFSGLSDEEKADVELAESLLASAEKVRSHQFQRASNLLRHCESMSSKTGNPVKRVVSYFAEALRERINRETRGSSSEVVEIPDLKRLSSFDPDKSMLTPSPASIACHRELPFSQVVEFAGIQAIIEKLNESRKIQIIDLGIRKGSQWTILMQALESRRECPVEILKITAIGTTMKHLLEQTGERLKSFAESMNIPFSFNIVMVSDMLQLNRDQFELDEEETIAVYSKFALRSMIPQPKQLEALMRVIRSLNPIVMVVTEVEANHNAKSFVSRFTEALFWFSAFFDCLETYMKREDPNRMVMEGLYFRHGIRNIVAAEGEERKVRNVKIEVWRAFFKRFGMVEEELSMSSKYQAELVAKRFASGEFCSLEMNGNSLLCGWRGTPLQSLSVWKFL